MLNPLRFAAALALGLTLGSPTLIGPALAGWTWAAEKYTQEQLNARFYYDLGPAEVDVSSYPQNQQAVYVVFKRTCSQCHTLARPINSPVVKREDWKRYVLRMHMHAKQRSRIAIGKKDAAAIIDFLSHDSRRRKVEHKADFDILTGTLKALFADMKKERMRLLLEENRAKARPSGYTGGR